MKFPRKQGFAFITTIYWLLLVYMVAALCWWFIALDKQNRAIAEIRLAEINRSTPAYQSKQHDIISLRNRKTGQYIGEGITFLAVIMVGAVFVFRATRRQFRLSRQQQNFMMAITHELKTPIAVTQLNLETLQKRKLDDDTQQRLISNTLEEANRLNELCNNILLATQLEAGYASSRQEINFTDLVEGCVDDFHKRFPRRQLQEAIQESVYLMGEELLLQMMVNNLVENAVKYSPRDGIIAVSLKQAGREVLLTITNEGECIPTEEKRKIFDKFYRIGNENTRRAKGTGLGLYLCSKIAESHNGYIMVTDNHPGGSKFTVSIPA